MLFSVTFPIYSRLRCQPTNRYVVLELTCHFDLSRREAGILTCMMDSSVISMVTVLWFPWRCLFLFPNEPWLEACARLTGLYTVSLKCNSSLPNNVKERCDWVSKGSKWCANHNDLHCCNILQQQYKQGIVSESIPQASMEMGPMRT